ncbi:hypothetical protein Tco_0966294 [Tanacetum coccineum]
MQSASRIGHRILGWVADLINCHLVQFAVIVQHPKDPSFFFTNRTGAPQGEELGLMKPLSVSSCSYSASSFILDGANLYGARATGVAPGSGYHQKDRKPSQNDKTERGMEKTVQNQGQIKHAQPEEVQELLSKLVQDMKIISDELSEYINTPAWNRPLVYCDDDDDEDYTIAITPILSTEEPVNSLIMEDEHLDTISATESDEFIKSSVEILVPIPSESKGVPKVCDVPFHDNSPPLDISKDQSEDFSDSNVDSTSTDEDSFR